MLVDFPFVPESDETIKIWIENLKKSGYSDEKISSLNLNINFHIPKNLTVEDDPIFSTYKFGVYEAKFSSSYNHVKLEPSYLISSFFHFIPVVVEQMKINDETNEKELVSSLLLDTYGFVFSLEEFFHLIGDQLEKSKRKFAVCFLKKNYHVNSDGSDTFRKSGRLYSFENSESHLKENDVMYQFHIFELISESDYIIPYNLNLDFLFHLFRQNPKEAVEIIENVHNEEFVTSILKDITNY